ncbi:T9SS type A sorting domain-containing protein [Chryseobacterium indologenes]|uniref:T9SS type A sorting domain-containing protein n=1 Tax=Chryseobacterium indologenes TaxID=253 RepID=UPI0009E8466F|nr:T9SS type A sorting domain-containing protein [Chryseobacterium indologenes]
MKYFKSIFFPFIISSALSAQNNSIEWQKSYGGSRMEQFPDIYQTNDGGYIIAGSSNSIDEGMGNHGFFDQWVVKVNAAGTVEWQRSYGGTADDKANSVRQTNDGGYIVAGSTHSTNGDVSNNHGQEDFWIVKLNSSGNIVWEKTLGGSGNDAAKCIRQTPDGGYIVAGKSDSNDGDITGNNGYLDGWIVKLDQNGGITWQKSIGGPNFEEFSSIELTADGGYVMAGNISTSTNSFNYWIVKVDSSGNTQWSKNYGGSASDKANSLKLTPDGGYIIAGSSNSNDGDITAGNGNYDYWIIKLDHLGNLQWQKSFGDYMYDNAFGIDNTEDGGLIVLGYSATTDTTNLSSNDYWLIKLNANGDTEWQRRYGGTQDDYASSVQQTADGGYIMAGVSNSFSASQANYDYRIIKLGPDTLGTNENTVPLKISLSPNPAKNTVYISHLPGETIINITDMSGRKLFSRKYNDQKVAIDVTPFSSGAYLVQVQYKGKIILSEKLILSK